MVYNRAIQEPIRKFKMFAIDKITGEKVEVLGPYSVSTHCVVVKRPNGKQMVQFKTMLNYLFQEKRNLDKKAA